MVHSYNGHDFVFCNSLQQSDLVLVRNSLRTFISLYSFGDPIITRRVYRNFPVIVSQKFTSAVGLEMLDFDVILGMYWLHSSYASVDCRTRIVRFQFLDEQILEQKSQFISYHKSRKMISKGYLYHLVQVKDSSLESLTLESVPVVCEFLEVFLEDVPKVPLERDLTISLM